MARYKKLHYKKSSKKSFSANLNFYKIFWVFFLGSFFGVVWETLYCLVTAGHMECRWGLIHGPFNPVYGFGAVLFTIILNKISHYRDLWIFLICTVCGGAFEYLCSFTQEKIFGTISWNYTDMKFNFAGRTNLLYSFFWGILGLLWVKEFYPRLSTLIEKFPSRFGKVLTYVALIYMILNIVLSSLAVERQTQRLHGKPANTTLAKVLDDLYPDEFLKKIYPNMKTIK